MAYKLLPHKYKVVGWLLVVPATIAGLFVSTTGYEVSWLQANAFTVFEADLFSTGQWFQWVKTNFTTTAIGTMFIVGGLIIALSEEKTEDEYIGKLRLSSLLWAVTINYVLLLLAFLLVQGLAFLTVMVYNMFTVLVLFITRFHYLLYKNSKMAQYEEFS